MVLNAWTFPLLLLCFIRAIATPPLQPFPPGVASTKAYFKAQLTQTVADTTVKVDIYDGKLWYYKNETVTWLKINARFRLQGEPGIFNFWAAIEPN